MYEIIVVDNASSDDTRKAVEEAAARWTNLCIRYFYEPTPGLLSARHRGVHESRGNLCAFVDDDVQVGNEWLNGLKDAFRDPAVVLVGGPSRPVFECAPPEWLDTFYDESPSGMACSWLSLFDGGDQVKQIHPNYVWGLNFTIRKESLFDLGGFHPDLFRKPLQRFQGDGETGLACAVASAGLKTLYHPIVVVHHSIPAPRLTVGYFEQRAFYQGVCDSYSRIRAKGRAGRYWTASRSQIKQMIQTIAKGLTGKNTVHYRAMKAYNAGFNFHQEEVRRDLDLLEWVLRRDYWDYNLPKGWERYQNTVDVENSRHTRQLP
jgi:glucosyl-dolichyl phosphate glucuronosyltransferase